jgi:hypothetical protein
MALATLADAAPVLVHGGGGLEAGQVDEALAQYRPLCQERYIDAHIAAACSKACARLPITSVVVFGPWLLNGSPYSRDLFEPCPSASRSFGGYLEKP